MTNATFEKRNRLAGLWSDKRGAVMMMFGLAAIPTMLLLGVGIDVARMASLKTKLQEAADAAVLRAGSQPALTTAQHINIATAAVAGNLSATVDTGAATSGTSPQYVTYTKVSATAGNVTVSYSENPGQYNVTITTNYKPVMMGLAGVTSVPLTVKAQATTSGVTVAHPLEVALALDNTGSMAPNIGALRTAAQTLADTVFAASNGSGAVRVSVTPYVAAVNPGLPSLSMVDTTALSPWNGVWQRWAWIAYTTGCVQNWGSGGGGTSTGPGGSSTGDAGDARDILDILNPIRHMAQELLGVKSANATSLGVTPNTIAPFTTSTLKSTYVKNSKKALETYQVPAGFQYYLSAGGTDGGGCDWLVNPATVSHYDLFPRILNTSGSATAWKGCVEARPTSAEISWINSNWGGSYTVQDYDVTDIAPTSTDANSLFVPYFWPDEPDYNLSTWAYMAPALYVNGSNGFHNNYLNDGDYASGSTTAALPVSSWNWTLNGSWGAGQYIFKYDALTKSAAINETGPTTAGPNAGCPEPVTRLTTNQSTVDTAIQNINYWYNGGTIISEGFAWAWRTLSPQPALRRRRGL